MFLDLIRRRNPALVEQAIALHQAGKLPANAYVIDLDAVEANARIIEAAMRCQRAVMGACFLALRRVSPVGVDAIDRQENERERQWNGETKSRDSEECA